MLYVIAWLCNWWVKLYILETKRLIGYWYSVLCSSGGGLCNWSSMSSSVHVNVCVYDDCFHFFSSSRLCECACIRVVSWKERCVAFCLVQFIFSVWWNKICLNQNLYQCSSHTNTLFIVTISQKLVSPQSFKIQQKAEFHVKDHVLMAKEFRVIKEFVQWVLFVPVSMNIDMSSSYSFHF